MRFLALIMAVPVLMSSVALAADPAPAPSASTASQVGDSTVPTPQPQARQPDAAAPAVTVPPVSPAPPAPVPPTPQVLLDRQHEQAGKVMADQAWARPGRMGGGTAVYLALRGGKVDDKLVSVQSPWAGGIEIHDSTTDAAGVVRMVALKELVVPADKTVSLEPRGKHLMVTGLTRELRPGQFFPLTLNFEKAGPVKAMVQVRSGQQMGIEEPPQGADAADHSGHQAHQADALSPPPASPQVDEVSPPHLPGALSPEKPQPPARPEPPVAPIVVSPER